VRLVQLQWALHKSLQIPPTAVGGSFKSFLYESLLMSTESRQRKLADHSSPTYSSSKINSKDLKYPPTTVSGITNRFKGPVYRKDLNHPPTAVGGIR